MAKPFLHLSPNTWEVKVKRLEVQGHLWLHDKFKASPGCLNMPCLKKKIGKMYTSEGFVLVLVLFLECFGSALLSICKV